MARGGYRVGGALAMADSAAPSAAKRPLTGGFTRFLDTPPIRRYEDAGPGAGRV